MIQTTVCTKGRTESDEGLFNKQCEYSNYNMERFLSVTVPEAGTWVHSLREQEQQLLHRIFPGVLIVEPRTRSRLPIQIQALGIALVIIVVALAFVFHGLNSPSKRPVQRVVFTQAPPTAPAPSCLCPSCGQAGLAPGTRFCPNCGQRSGYRCLGGISSILTLRRQMVVG